MVRRPTAVASKRPDSIGADLQQRSLVALVLFVPIVVTFLYVRAFAVELPFQDDWDFIVPHVQDLATGQLSWSDINVQHNEALVLLPEVVMLVLARVSGYQLIVGIYANYLFVCGCLIILFLFFRLLRLPGRWSTLWFLPVSLLFMGWRQSDSLLWSTMLSQSMALFFALSALYCCTQAYRIRAFFPLAVLAGWSASFSLPSGLFVWPLGAIYFAVAGLKKGWAEQAIRYIAGWLVFGGICGALFILDHRPHIVPWPVGLAFVFAHPIEAAQYVSIYLGSPLSSTPNEALYTGFIFVLLALPALFFALRLAREIDGVLAALLLPAYVGIALGPLLYSRFGLGVEQGFTSRYVMTGVLAPTGIYFCLLALMRPAIECRYLVSALLVLLVSGILHAYPFGLREGRQEWSNRTNCARVIRNFRESEPRQFLCAYPDPAIVLQRVPGMEANKLSLFRK
ncbi:MAG: hypothetical protein C5B51_24750 [Terriglobia bacterium]|nr:MAG: hypothetical protein C5B51_24750 [Terriglobia bacterium]